ncbi:tumor necrosis factor receptor superfamily member 1B isoform X1 [Cricetulus griseus]|uniref:tumor necrosis factor receptor superfamily member 1B isoform X1 n=1 Tax=Cricetulus griseus TaxID=10029 RepID=UPI0015C33B21|nr:tumor necrosis factor receptor superfamily member 1B isoform X1 [Cricetulus griseus]
MVCPSSRPGAFAFSHQLDRSGGTRGPGSRAGATAAPMAPAALWVALVIGLQLWTTGHTVPAQVTLTPYMPEPGDACRDPKEYYNKKVQMCCAACPPGQHVKHFCTQTSDTVCADCEEGTYTKLWNRLPTCLSCGSRCGDDQVKTQACTKQQNRVCTCKADMYCALPTNTDSCRQCIRLSKCGPGFGVAGTRSANGNVVCKACAPGTFSDTTSSTDMCKPHRICSILAIPGNASRDAVCASESPAPSTIPGTVYVSHPEPTRTQPLEPEPESNPIPPTFSVFESLTPRSAHSTNGGISLPIGLIVGVTTLSLLVIGLANCFILVQKKKKPSCLQREAKVAHLPDEKSRGGATGLEQQRLLTTAPSSSSSSLESSASAGDRRAPPRSQPQATATEEVRGSQEACAGSRSSDSSLSSHGTHVNVTCIVNVCSSPDHSSQCSSQASTTVGDPDANPSGSPKDEQVPFSQEECPSQSQWDAPETLQSHEKPLPLGVPDVGMKPNQPGWCDQVAAKVA